MTASEKKALLDMIQSAIRETLAAELRKLCAPAAPTKPRRPRELA